MESFPCPCCGYLVFDEPPGSFDICPICFWEDDAAQLRFVARGGANRVSLLEAQQNCTEFGVSEPGIAANARPPSQTEPRDPEWRPLDPLRDRIEEPDPTVPYGSSHSLGTALYYWRSSNTLQEAAQQMIDRI